MLHQQLLWIRIYYAVLELSKLGRFFVFSSFPTKQLLDTHAAVVRERRVEAWETILYYIRYARDRSEFFCSRSMDRSTRGAGPGVTISSEFRAAYPAINEVSEKKKKKLIRDDLRTTRKTSSPTRPPQTRIV